MLDTPYYVFNADGFIDNYKCLVKSFRSIYPNYNLAYSFKTNYTPAVCNIVLELGGYAEIVSDMEFELAKRVGFPIEHIIYNGPGKENYFEECIINGGLLNIDNYSEIDKVLNIAKSHKGISVGIRVNFDIGNGLHSRFGIDANNGDLERAVVILRSNGVQIKGLHFHISRARGLDAWNKRINTLVELADRVETLQGIQIDYLDIGSGMFGDLGETLREQFGTVPSYDDYAGVVATVMANHYKERNSKPILFTEPGTTVISKYFSLYSKVLDIKTIRDKCFALLDCSFHNVGEICGLKKVPMNIRQVAEKQKYYDAIDLVGYTCLEQDIIYHDYEGKLGVGDIIEFENVGGYSIVDKPPFIHPDIPIYMDRDNKRTCIKRAQTINDIFAPYFFEY